MSVGACILSCRRTSLSLLGGASFLRRGIQSSHHRAPGKRSRNCAAFTGGHSISFCAAKASDRKWSRQNKGARSSGIFVRFCSRLLDDVFAIQSEIAKTIADQSDAKISPGEKAAIENQPIHDL